MNYANLVVTGVILPSVPVLSGGQVTYSYQVVNTGNAVTDVASWYDRIVFSRNQIYGDFDDMPSAVIPHYGNLESGSSYIVTNVASIPDEISGEFYLIVHADAFNSVNEFTLDADNIRTSDNPLIVNLKPYPDLVVENINVIPPETGIVYTFKWITTNRGSEPTPEVFYERFILRNDTSGSVLLNTERVITNSLPAGSFLTNSLAVSINEGGNFTIMVITDSRNSMYEYNESGHQNAEQNLNFKTFSVVRTYSVNLTVNPTGAGYVSGSGSYISGTSVSVSALANTNLIPYRFVNWTENGIFQSASANYTFTQLLEIATSWQILSCRLLGHCFEQSTSCRSSLWTGNIHIRYDKHAHCSAFARLYLR